MNKIRFAYRRFPATPPSVHPGDVSLDIEVIRNGHERPRNRYTHRRSHRKSLVTHNTDEFSRPNVSLVDRF